MKSCSLRSGRKRGKAPLAALQGKSPFQGALEQGWTGANQAETIDTESAGRDLFLEGETGVIDGDNRVRINNTLGVPWRWICQIEIEDDRGRPRGGGTGLLISDRHVLTAAHVVFEKYKNPQQYSVYVTPARDYGAEPSGRYLISARPKIPTTMTPTPAKTNPSNATTRYSKSRKRLARRLFEIERPSMLLGQREVRRTHLLSTSRSKSPRRQERVDCWLPGAKRRRQAFIVPWVCCTA